MEDKFDKPPAQDPQWVQPAPQGVQPELLKKTPQEIRAEEGALFIANKICYDLEDALRIFKHDIKLNEFAEVKNNLQKNYNTVYQEIYDALLPVLIATPGIKSQDVYNLIRADVINLLNKHLPNLPSVSVNPNSLFSQKSTKENEDKFSIAYSEYRTKLIPIIQSCTAAKGGFGNESALSLNDSIVTLFGCLGRVISSGKMTVNDKVYTSQIATVPPAPLRIDFKELNGFINRLGSLGFNNPYLLANPLEECTGNALRVYNTKTLGGDCRLSMPTYVEELLENAENNYGKKNNRFLTDNPVIMAEKAKSIGETLDRIEQNDPNEKLTKQI
jgi:hypothetical protein